jgi:hypothetical protein
LVVLPGQTQAPETQACPPAQARPHKPQLLGSTMVLTHARAQLVEPAHASLHTPLLHTWAAVHLVPHAPQLFGSDAVDTQTPLQLVGVPTPATGAHPQTPAVQTWPSGHCTPQAPQFCALAAVSTQAPWQSVVPAGQSAVQVRLAQTWPPAHSLSQAPQKRWLVRSTQLLPHRVVPDRQPQKPFTQT